MIAESTWPDALMKIAGLAAFVIIMWLILRQK